MELRVIRKSDDYIEIEALDEDPSLFDSLSEIVQRIEGVEYAGITVEHPLTRKVIMRVKTNPEKIKADEAVSKAVKELSDISQKLLESFQQL